MVKNEIKGEGNTNTHVVSDAIASFQGGLYCSEAILKSFNEHYNLGLTKEVLKIATAFGAGLGASKCCCGCLTGGAMVLSLVAGRTTPEESEATVFHAVSTLHDQFKEEFGATCCRVLTRSVEWGTPGHHEYCTRFVRGATVLIEALLRENLVKYLPE